MKRTLVPGLVLLAALAARVVPGQTTNVSPAPRPAADASLPSSLDKLYPPSAGQPLWLMAMFEMGQSFSGMISDFMEGDHANAEAGYAEFRQRYGNLSRMVPEWAVDLPSQPVDDLGSALKSRDPARFMQAVQVANRVCEGCHVRNMARVQYTYHWGDFGAISVSDPVSKTDVPFRLFMQMLDGDLSGVPVDLAQGQVDQARQHAAGLSARYRALKEACAACHDSERTYFVDASVTGKIDRLGASLAGDAPDPAGIGNLVQGIGMESCHKCHLVHAPAAMARHRDQLPTE